MYCIFWPLIHKFVRKAIFLEELSVSELSVGRIVRWANCPLGELSVGELSGHDSLYCSENEEYHTIYFTFESSEEIDENKIINSQHVI